MAKIQPTGESSDRQDDRCSVVTNEEIISAYRQWKSARRVARELGVNRNRVRVVLANSGDLPVNSSTAPVLWRRRNDKEIQKQRIAQGLCRYCDQPASCPGGRCQQHLELYRRKKVSNRGHGLCVVCHERAEPGLSRCASCLHQIRIRRVDTAKDRLAEGLCIRCGLLPHDAGRQSCADCRRKDRLTLAETRRQRRESGLCERCGRKPATVRQKHCEACYIAIMATSHTGTALDGPKMQEKWEKCKGICAYSGHQLTLGVNASIDHIVPLARGGASSTDNLQWTHADVNQMKSNLTEEEFLQMVSDIFRHALTPGEE